jgi:hypothetical protein
VAWFGEEVVGVALIQSVVEVHWEHTGIRYWGGGGSTVIALYFGIFSHSIILPFSCNSVSPTTSMLYQHKKIEQYLKTNFHHIQRLLHTVRLFFTFILQISYFSVKQSNLRNGLHLFQLANTGNA